MAGKAEPRPPVEATYLDVHAPAGLLRSPRDAADPGQDPPLPPARLFPSIRQSLTGQPMNTRPVTTAGTGS
jgi:hypothetical protein